MHEIRFISETFLLYVANQPHFCIDGSTKQQVVLTLTFFLSLKQNEIFESAVAAICRRQWNSEVERSLSIFPSLSGLKR